MNIALHWTTSQSASCFHAVDALRRGRPLADKIFAAALAEPAEHLLEELRAEGLPEEPLFRHLVPLSAGIESNYELAEIVLRKVVGTGPRADAFVHTLAGCIGEIESAARKALPGMIEDLPALAQPLEDRWRAEGPMLFNRIAQLTDPRLIVSEAGVVLVHPVSAGGGSAHLNYNTVRIEPVGEQPTTDLPEVLRLVWMLAQLNVDLPMFSENILADRRPTVAELALLPPVLEAAETAELATCNLATIREALGAWCSDPPQQADMPETLFDWWQTYREALPPWHVALSALDQMIGANAVSAAGT
jgi:hypothetical protein